jgi:hypothetical protein
MGIGMTDYVDVMIFALGGVSIALGLVAVLSILLMLW